MEELKTILYCREQELPPWWQEAISSKPMLRLKGVGMNCGLEYTQFPVFQGIHSYSRYTHSLGVGAIVWKLSHDAKQTLSALYHDISTPCFAHVVDFLNGDYLGQESTEEGTRQILERSDEIQKFLAKLGLKTSDVDDYHRYPIADTPSPSLSADRLEYTCSNAINLLREESKKIQSVYDDVVLLKKGDLGFEKESSALELGLLSLRCGGIYSCDEDRYSMEVLARLLRKALASGVLSMGDLMGEEDGLIRRMLDSHLKEEWFSYRSLSALEKSEVPLSPDWLQIQAKKRYIDPSLNGTPLTQKNASFQAEVEKYRQKEFSVYLKAV